MSPKARSQYFNCKQERKQTSISLTQASINPHHVLGENYLKRWDGLGRLFTAKRFRMYAPAVTPRPITSSNLHKKRGAFSWQCNFRWSRKKRCYASNCYACPIHRGEKRIVWMFEEWQQEICLLTQSNREFRQLDQRGHQQTIMLALVRFRVPPPSQFQVNKVKARS